MAHNFALLLLRLTGLYLALAHGWGKLHALAGGGEVRFVAGVEALGFPLPTVFAWAAALAEFAGGLCVACGLFTRVAAAATAFTMFVAAFLRHRAYQHALVALGLTSTPAEQVEQWGNPELAILYLLPFLAILLLGPGRYSLDQVLRGKGRSGSRRSGGSTRR